MNKGTEETMKSNEEETKQEEEKEEEQGEKEKSRVTKRVIRIVTVIAYVVGVSGAGFLMSLYYLIFWDPQIETVKPPTYAYLKNSEGALASFSQSAEDHSRSVRSPPHFEDDQEIHSKLDTLLKLIQNTTITINNNNNKYFGNIINNNETDNLQKSTSAEIYGSDGNCLNMLRFIWRFRNWRGIALELEI